MFLPVLCMHTHVRGHACLFMCVWDQRWLWISFSATLCPIFWAWMSLFCLNWLAIENLGSTCLWHPSLGITGWCYCAPTLFGYRERIWTHVFMVAHQELCPLNHLCSPIIECAFIYLFSLFFIYPSLRYHLVMLPRLVLNNWTQVIVLSQPLE